MRIAACLLFMHRSNSGTTLSQIDIFPFISLLIVARKIQNKMIQMTAKPVASFILLCQYYCTCMCTTIIKSKYTAGFVLIHV